MIAGTRSRGFTLIEMMSTLVVSAVALGLGIPGFQVLAANTQRDALVKEFTMSLLFARNQAVRKGIPVSLCASRDGTACDRGDTAQWRHGWILFKDPNGNQIPDHGEEVLRVNRVDYPRISVAGSDAIGKAVTYRPSGTPVATGWIRFCAADQAQARTVDLNFVGRIRVADDLTGCTGT